MVIRAGVKRRVIGRVLFGVGKTGYAVHPVHDEIVKLAADPFQAISANAQKDGPQRRDD